MGSYKLASIPHRLKKCQDGIQEMEMGVDLILLMEIMEVGEMLTMTEDLVEIGVQMVEGLIQMRVMVTGVQMDMMEVVQMLMMVGMMDFTVEMMVDSMADQKVDVLKDMMILEVVETGSEYRFF